MTQKLSEAMLLDLPLPIVTPRLVLRPPARGDGPMVFHSIKSSMDSLSPWLDWVNELNCVDKAEFYVRKSLADWILRKKLRFLCFIKDNKKLIGEVSIDPINWNHSSGRLKYWRHQDYEGFGFMSESINAITQYSFTHLKINRLELYSDSYNKKNIDLAKRLGFEFEGRLKSKLYRKQLDVYSDLLIFSRTEFNDLAKIHISWGNDCL
jgi:RimJ/RimL family protein N-acetyltransferase